MPSGFEQFYARAAELFAAGAPDPHQLRALATEYGYEILAPGPPMPSLELSNRHMNIPNDR